MEAKVDIFVFVPQMHFTENEIIDAEDRLEGFARVMHANQDVCVHKPAAYVDEHFEPIKNAAIIADVLEKIVEIEPDEIFIAGAYDCEEVNFIRNFAKLAGIKLVIFDIENVNPGYFDKIYSEKDCIAEA